MINEQEIKRLFSKLQNIQTGTTTGGNAGSRIWLKLPQNQVQATCIKDVDPGDCLGIKADDGQWYVTQTSPASGEERSRHQISYRKCEQKPKGGFTVITLLQQDQNLYQQPLKPDYKIVEYWITGGTYPLKQIKTNPELGFNDDEAFAFVDAADAFIHNYGKKKFILSTNRFQENKSFFEGANNRGYQKQEFLFKDKNNLTTYLAPEFSGTYGFAYLGNGIYQSFIEDGIGQVLDAMDDGLSIGNNLMFRANFFTAQEYNNGFGRDRERLTVSDQSGTYSTSTFTNRLDSNILPDAKNITILQNNIIENTGSLSIDVQGIYDFDLEINNKSFLNPSEFSNNYNLIKDSQYLKTIIIIEIEGGFTPDMEFRVIYRHPPLFGWRNRNISHQVWLPTGNTTFTFSSQASVNGNLYTYDENMSGELMVMSWEKDYITHNFSGVSKETKYIHQELSTEDPPVEFLTEVTTKGTQDVILKKYGDNTGDNNLILNSSGKYLILTKEFRQLNSDSFQDINLDTNAFRIRIRKSVAYYETFNPNLNLNNYIGEAIITSTAIGNSNYIVRGFISSIDEVTIDVTKGIKYIYVTITITEKTKIPTIKANSPWLLYFSDPLYRSIILDNGCFWNYYLSYRSDNSLLEFKNTYRRFNYQGNAFDYIAPYSGENVFMSTTDDLICDQTVGFIHTNPITVPFCAGHRDNRYFPPSNLLIVDNLVGKSIFRVDEYSFLNSYVNKYNYDELKIKKIPISEWKIGNEGNVKYRKTFLVDYKNKFPFTDSSGILDSSLTQFGSSYHPKV